jgi:SAM-dependent methyltransferase
LVPRGRKIVDVGSGENRLRSDIVRLDKAWFENSTLLGDAHWLPFGDDSVGGILCFGVLEHAERPWEIIKEMRRVIMPGGAVYVGVPFIQGFHVDEKCVTDYWRFTHQGIQRLCEKEGGFEQVESGEGAGAGSSLAWVLREFFIHFVPDVRWVRGAGALAAAYASFWLRFADRIRRDKATTVACSVYFIGVKRAAASPSTAHTQ